MSNDKLSATGYTPASDPWEALAAHGAPPPPDPDPAVDRMHYASPGVPPWGSLHQDIGHEPPSKRRLPAWAVVSMVLGVVALLVAGGVVAGLTGSSGPVPTVPAIPAPADVNTSGTCEKRIVGEYGLVATVRATNASRTAQTGVLWVRWPITGEAAQEFTKRAELAPGESVELPVNQAVKAERWFRTGACSYGWTPDAAEGGQGGGSVLGIDWGTTTTPANKRVIEVVDKIGPSKWHVSAAVNWLDKYTASDMRMVSRCSGKAYRCITVRTGRNKSSPGWSQGNTITIDLKRTGALNRYYRYDSRRTWLLAHELGHQFGLGHASKTSRTLMNPYVNRGKMSLTSGQRAHLRKR